MPFSDAFQNPEGFEPKNDYPAPPWETRSWLRYEQINGVRKALELPQDISERALEQGRINQTEYEYINSSDPEQRLTRLERFLGYNEHRGPLENAFGLIETVTGYRALVSTSAAVTQGLVDDGGFGLAFSTDEFKRAWQGRTSYKDIFARGADDQNSWGVKAAGLVADIVLDPSTWLTVGVKTGAKVTMRASGAGQKILAENLAARGISSVPETLSLTRYGEDIYKIASRDFLKEASNEVYEKMFKAAGHEWKPGSVLPEHFQRVMRDTDLHIRFNDFVNINYERYATEWLDLMRKGGSLSGRSQFRSMRPDGIVTSLAEKIGISRLSAGPSAMYQQTAGLWRKEFGIPADRLLGEAALALNTLEGVSAEIATRASVPESLRAATSVVKWFAGKSYGAVNSIQRFFSHSLERLPVEDRFLVQSFMDDAFAHTSDFSANIRAQFNRPLVEQGAGGLQLTRNMTRDDRILISHHLDNPAEHELPDYLKSHADWAAQQFDDIFEEERRWGISGERISDYVPHIYSANAFKKMYRFIADAQEQMKLGTSKHAKIHAENIHVKNRFALHRSVATLDDALDWFGNENVELDIANILFRRRSISERMIAKKKTQAYVVSQYGIGGVADQFLMENASIEKMLRLANYHRRVIDLGPTGKITDNQIERLKVMALEIADLDLAQLGKRVSETREGRLSKREPASRKITASPYMNPDTSTTTTVLKGEDGKFYQTKRVYDTDGQPKVISEKTIPWFDEWPPVPKTKKEKQAARELRLADIHKENIGKLSWISQKVFGAPLSGLTMGQADVFKDFLNGMIDVKRIIDKTGQLSGALRPRWRSMDPLVVAKLHGGGVEKVKYFGQPDESGRILPGAERVWNIDADQWGRVAREVLKRRGVEPTEDMITATIEQMKQNGTLREVSFANLDTMEMDALAARRKDLKEEAQILRQTIRELRKDMASSPEKIYDTFEAASKKMDRINASIEATEKKLAEHAAKTTEAIKAYRSHIKEKQALRAKLRREMFYKAGKEKSTISLEKRIASAERSIDFANDRLEKIKNLNVDARLRARRESLGAESRETSDLLAKAEADLPLADDVTAVEIKLDKAKATSADLDTLLARQRERYSRTLDRVDGLYVLPQSMVDAIDQASSSAFVPTDRIHQLLKGYQQVQKWFKVPLTLPFPEHHARNAVTNIALTATRLGMRMLHPTNWRVALNTVGHLLHRMDKVNAEKLGNIPNEIQTSLRSKIAEAAQQWKDSSFVDSLGQRHTYEEVTKEAISRGINHAFVHAELANTPFLEFDNATHGWLSAASRGTRVFFRNIQEKMVGVSAGMELITDIPFRVAMFTDEVANGASYDEAAETVRSYLNDWGRLSPQERVYMRTLIPFYSWMQFSLERAFKDAVTNPGMFVLPYKVADALSESPPNYTSRYMDERLGIWSAPNEYGYYTKLVGFGFNQEEALRQWNSMRSMANLFGNTVLKMPVVGSALEAVFPPSPPAADGSPWRFLANLDFGLRSAIEFSSGRELFTGAPIGAPGAEDLSLLERSRLESGYGWSRLDDPDGIVENVVTVGGVGGKWLKNWLEYTEDPRDPDRARVNAFKRWMIGQTPVSRFFGEYERFVRNKRPGEANYASIARGIIGLDLYRHNEKEGKYYMDRARLRAAASILRQAHMMDSGVHFFESGFEQQGAKIIDVEEIRKQMKERR